MIWNGGFLVSDLTKASRRFYWVLFTVLGSNLDRWMRAALQLARQAFDEGEVPIGAVIVHNNRIIGEGYNQRESLKDPTAHAEMIAITQAAQSLESWRLVRPYPAGADASARR